jgi:serine protease Do
MQEIRSMIRHLTLAVVTAGLLAGPGRADTPFVDVHEKVNDKMCKLFGSGGIKGLVHYATGLVVSPDGYILTIASPTLDTRNLRVHLSDGRRYENCKVVVVEPALDIALVKIDTKEKNLNLPYWDIAEAARKPLVRPATGVLAFSNQFEIATRDELMSIQQGVISSITKLQGRRGIHEASFHEKVYVVDAITNNPGAAGGALTDTKGNLLGIIGKELKNELSNTWINYAIPIQTAVEVVEENEKKRTVSIVELVEKKEGFKVSSKVRTDRKTENFTGIILVPNVVELTPPYVEEVMPGSPAAKAGLQPDDLIAYVDGEQVSSITELLKVFSRIRPDTPVKLEVRRGDKLQTVTFVMGKPLRAPRAPQPDKPPQPPEK